MSFRYLIEFKDEQLMFMLQYHLTGSDDGDNAKRMELPDEVNSR